MDLRENIRAHWQEQLHGKQIEVKVAEWSDQPVCFRRRLSMAERTALDIAKRDGDHAWCVEFLFQCARDPDGARLFTSQKDRRLLEQDADPKIMTRIFLEAYEQMTQPVGDVEGNSAAVQT